MGKIINKRCKNVKVTEVTIIDCDSPPPRTKFEKFHDFTGKDVNPSNKSNEIIDITDDYDHVFNQTSSSKRKCLNVEYDFTINKTDLIVYKPKEKNTAILSSEIKELNIEDNFLIDITDSIVDESDPKNTSILSSEVQGVNVENESEQINTTILSSKRKRLNVEDDFTINKTNSIVYKPIPKNTAILSSEIKELNVENDFIIDLTHSIVDESEPKNTATISSEVNGSNIENESEQKITAILSSETKDLNIEDDFIIDITDSIVDESEPKNTSILSSEVNGLNVENESEQRNTVILSSETKDLNVEDDSIVDITDSIVDEYEPKNTATLSSEVKGLNVEDESDQRNTAIVSSEIKDLIVKDDSTVDITDSIVDGSEPKNTATLSSEVKGLNVKDDSTVDITDSIVDGSEPKNTAILSPNKKLHSDLEIFSPAINVHYNEIGLVVLNSKNEKHTQKIQRIKTVNNTLRKSNAISSHYKKAFKRKFYKNGYYHNHLFNAGQPSFNLDELGVNYQNMLQHSNTEEIQNVRVPLMPPQPCTTLNTARQLRPIYIDGLNVGHTYGHGVFSVKGIELCVEYFAARGHTDILVFIPHHRQGPPGSMSKQILEKLYQKGHVCYTPSRKINDLRMTCYDDRIILNQAVKYGAVVISNDNFRDLYLENEAFREVIETRHVMITFARDEIIVPDDQYNGGPYILTLSDILCFPA